MAKVAWTTPARDDLRKVYDFIATDSPRYAAKTVERIQHAVSRLERFSLSGHALPEFPQTLYRQILVGPYRVLYRADAPTDRVLVMAIVHSARDLLAAFPLADES